MAQAMIDRVSETRSLPELEAVIERGLATFVDVGTALLEIREGRLYRDSHSTFEDYCRERWGFSDRRARYLMTAAEIVTEIGTTVPVPTNERQVRELARIPADQRAEVWQRVVSEHGERVTAQHIREVRSEESPAYDPPLLSVVDLETGEIVRPQPARVVDAEARVAEVPEIPIASEEERLYDRLVALTGVTNFNPAEVAQTAMRRRGAGSIRMYLARAEAIVQWHERFAREMRAALDSPLQRVK
jgi:hypothetical protein